MANNNINKKAVPTKKYKLLKDFKTTAKSYKKGSSIDLTEKGARQLKKQNLI